MFICNLVGALALVISVGVGTSHAQWSTTYVDQDARIVEDSSTNYGGDTYIELGTGKFEERAVFSLSLSAPCGNTTWTANTVNQAYFTLTVADEDLKGIVELSLFVIDEPPAYPGWAVFGEWEVNWFDKAFSTHWQSSGSTLGTFLGHDYVEPGDAQKIVKWDVTSVMQNHINSGLANEPIGFVLLRSNGGKADSIYFYSQDAVWNPSVAPQFAPQLQMYTY